MLGGTTTVRAMLIDVVLALLLGPALLALLMPPPGLSPRPRRRSRGRHRKLAVAG